jgi:hypothetical protein
VRRARGLPFEADVDDLFRDDPGAGQVLAIIGDPAGQESCVTAVRAARDAIGAGGLVVISPEPGLAGLWASLHAEHPALGITVLRVPGTADGLRMAREHAAVIPGELRELVIDAVGEVCEPVMAPAEVPGGAALPLGPGDVVLIGRGGGGAALALAQAAACCGAAVAVIGQPDPDEGADVAPGLDQLRAAGARVGCELIDITDAAELDAAVLRIEQVLGPVTAVGYAAEAGGAVPIAELTEAGLRAQVVAQTAGLGHLLSAVGTEGLRLIVTSGSVAGRYGLAGASLLAVAGGSLAQQARRLADAIPGCQALHVDWPSWAGPDTPGQRAAGGVDPITVRDGSRMLIKLLGTPALPARLAVHGRVGVPAPQALAGPPGADPVAAWTGAGRFTSDVRLHYPGIELICEARLSLQTDPYLADYRMDGISVLPPALALEAMAQVASALTGRALRQATGVSIRAPIVIPEAAAAGQALIRICALRVRDVVQVVVRCAESGYGIEHYRAAFAASAEPAAAAPDAQQAGPAAADAGADGTDADWTGVSAQAAAGIVDGTELYGPICFPSGRFRRIAVLTEVTSRSCRAVARGGDDQPWFSGVGDVRLLLGSPGLADATLQVLQACVPHRNLLPAGCESVTFSGRSAEGAVRIEAAAVAPGPVARVPAPRPTPEPASTAMVPPQAASPEDDRPAGRTPGADGAGAGAAGAGAAGAGAAGAGAAGAAVAGAAAAGAAGAGATRPAAGAGGDDPARDDPILAQAWDVRALDRAGQPLIIWRGVRMRDAGPMPRNAAWPPPLLAIYLERVCVELGLDPGLRVAMRRAQPPGDDPGTPSGSHGEAGPEGGSGEQAEAPGGPGGGAPEPAEPAGTANGQGQLAGFTLSVRIAGAAGSAACGWSVAEAGPLAEPDADQAYPAARAQMLSGFLGEPPATVGARLRAIARCLVMAGAPAGCPIAIRDIADDGWILLSAVGAIMACTVADIGGVSAPVAIALMTGTPTWDRNAGPGQAARSAQRAPARS